jgi:hypothetical protein
VGDDDGVFTSGLGGDFQSPPQDGGLQAAASIRLERGGSVEAYDFVVGDDEAGASGNEFGVGFGGFGNESDRSGEGEHGSQHLVEARRLSAVWEEAFTDDGAERQDFFGFAGADGEARGAGREGLGGIEFADENVVELGDCVAALAGDF